jgi:nucleoside-diphosphate-sugar epimerase
MSGRILVLGAAGRLGRVAAQAFRDRGWSVVSQVRPGSAAAAVPQTQAVEAHALDEDTIVQAARGADAILHALNPPYADWPQLVPQFAAVAISAARSSGATLLFPGNLYVYGAGLPALLDEQTPMHPTSRKGALRLAVEEHMRAAADSGMRTIILRAGDYFGGPGMGAWFDRVLVSNLGNGRVIYPGPLNTMHEWTYLPDLAEALVRLAERRASLPPFASFGFPGHAVTGREFVAAIAKLTRTGRVRVSGMPWWLLRAVAPVVPTYREITEIAYLWREPHRIDGERLKETIGDIPHTPLDEAVAGALRALGAPV